MKNRTPIVILAFLSFLMGCRTTYDLEVPDYFIEDMNRENVSKNIWHKEYIIVEKPVYIIADDVVGVTQEEKDGNEGKKLPIDTAFSMIESSTINPNNKEVVRWEGALLEYDYNEGKIYHVYTSPYRITDIQLQQGETIIGELITGDSSRWLISSGISDVMHVYLKPTKPNLETTMIINTNRRRYYLIIRSYDQKYMMGVKFRYPLDELKNMAAKGEASLSRMEYNDYQSEEDSNFESYSFNYEITIPRKFKDVSWVPEFVYDDGQKTYIVLKASALNHQLPVLHLGKKKAGEIVNYRTSGKVLIVDRLVSEITLRIEDKWAVISKEKGTRENG